MPETTPAAEVKPRIDLLYIGCREVERGQPLCHLWHDLTGIDNDGSPLAEDQARHQMYGSKKRGHLTQNIAFASPGAIYSFERSENGVFSSTARYVGRWQCEEDVLKWTAVHNAIERTAELAQRARKENREHVDWQALEPFRKAYQQQLNYKQQQMLLAQLIQFITTYRPES